MKKSHPNSAQNSIEKNTPTPDTFGILRVNPDLKPPKGYKQLCNQCGFDRFSVAYHYCPNCGAESANHCRYVAINGGL